MIIPGYMPSNLIFIIILFVVILFFAATVRKLYRILKLGQPEDRFNDYGRRLKGVLAYAFGQKRVLREPSGFGHFIIFWGFIFISIYSLESFGVGLYHGISFRPILGKTIYGIIYLLQDIFCLGVIVALIISLYRRFVIKPIRLQSEDPKATTKDALIIISLIITLIILLFGERATASLIKDDFPRMAFISVWISNIFAGLSTKGLLSLNSFFWWTHTLVLLAFLVYIPFSKHLHILGAIPNIFFRRFSPVGELTKLDLEDEEAESFGVGRIEDFTWKQLLDEYACTECGRCTENCPAFLTGKPLAPKDTIHRLKEHLIKKGQILICNEAEGGNGNEEGAEGPDVKVDGELSKALIGDVCKKDEIWSCTTCGNCVANCPELIEHVQKFVDMRRYLVLTESDFPQELGTVFRNWENNSNPWGIGFATRGDWAKDLPVKLLSEDNNVEYLLYVGCAGSFDERGKKVSTAVVNLLNEAGISFGILGKEEKCCGETLRRLGNEYQFQMMAMELVETINNYGIKKIITICPHGYNCLKNEYHQFGGEWEVYHHTEILMKLVKEGKLRPEKPMNLSITYHDSCYLGRYNDIYEEPRAVLKNIPGTSLKEMERNMRKSFCCGAGGGRMWMEETLGDMRINEARTDQALAVSPDVISVACPFCLTMMEDGLKARGKEEEVKVLDVAEILWNSIKKDES